MHARESNSTRAAHLQSVGVCETEGVESGTSHARMMIRLKVRVVVVVRGEAALAAKHQGGHSGGDVIVRVHRDVPAHRQGLTGRRAQHHTLAVCVGDNGPCCIVCVCVQLVRVHPV